MTRTILHIDADAFFASVEQGFNPKLLNRPVIVGGTENQRGVVHTASYDARQLGVCTGMPLRQAKRLVPNAIFLKGNFEHYKAVSQAFRDIYYRYTPDVEMTSLDDAYLDLTGTLQHHGRVPKEIAESIQKQIYDATRVTVSCGISTSKLLARIASGIEKPRGLTCVPVGHELAFLHALPVEKLPGIGRMMRESLHQLEIYSVGQLAALPKYLLIQRFGKNGLKFWKLANGIDPREVKQKAMPKQISRETGFEEDVSDLDLVVSVLRYLTERIGKKLRQENLVGRNVAIKVDYSDRRRFQKSRVLPEPTSCTETIYTLVKSLLQEMPFRRSRIHRVGLTVANIERQDHQLQLFWQPTRQQVLESTVDAIRRRFGFTAIMPARLLELQRLYRMEKSGYVLHAPALTQ